MSKQKPKQIFDEGTARRIVKTYVKEDGTVPYRDILVSIISYPNMTDWYESSKMLSTWIEEAKKEHIEINLEEQYSEMLSEIVKSVNVEQEGYDGETWTNGEFAYHLLLDAIIREYNNRFESE